MSKQLKFIYLVSMVGYEWDDAIEAFTTKKKADKKAEEWNEDFNKAPLTKHQKRWADMSEFQVSKIKLN